MEKHRLVLTHDELVAVKTALHSFVTRTCGDPTCASAAEIEAMPHAAQVLLHYFKGW